MSHCQNPNHSGAERTDFCLNDNCHRNRLFCIHCLFEKHVDHHKDVIHFPISKNSRLQHFAKNSDFGQQQIRQFKNYIQELRKEIKESKNQISKSIHYYEEMIEKQIQQPLLTLQQSFSSGTVQQVARRILNVDRKNQNQELEFIAQQLLKLQKQPKRSNVQMKKQLQAIKHHIFKQMNEATRIFKDTFFNILQPLKNIDIWDIKQEQRLNNNEMQAGNEQIPQIPVSHAFGNNVKLQHNHQRLKFFPKYFGLSKQDSISISSENQQQQQSPPHNHLNGEKMQQNMLKADKTLEKIQKQRKRKEDKQRRKKKVAQALKDWGRCVKGLNTNAFLNIEEWVQKSKGLGYLKTIFIPVPKDVKVINIPPEMSYLKNLESLRIVNCNVSRIQYLATCVRLKALDLSHNRIDKIANLQKLINLQTLKLCSNLIQVIQNFDNNHNLKHINLSHNKIKKIENIKHLNKLSHLVLSNNRIDNVEFEYCFPAQRISGNQLQIFLDNNLAKKSSIERNLFYKNIYLNFHRNFLCQCLQSNTI